MVATERRSNSLGHVSFHCMRLAMRFCIRIRYICLSSSRRTYSPFQRGQQEITLRVSCRWYAMKWTNITRPNSAYPRSELPVRPESESLVLSCEPYQALAMSTPPSHSPFAHLTSTHPVDTEIFRIPIESKLDIAKQLGTVLQGTVKPSTFLFIHSCISDRHNPHSDHTMLYT